MLAERELAPDAIEVTCIGGYILRVRFENGEIRDFDVEKQLLPRSCYDALRNPAIFKLAHIDYGTVVWNDKLDIDPEWLYEESVPVK